MIKSGALSYMCSMNHIVGFDVFPFNSLVVTEGDGPVGGETIRDPPYTKAILVCLNTIRSSGLTHTL